MYIYYSGYCSNYGTLFAVLMKYGIPFEWHSRKRGCKRCYADFYIDKDTDPALWEIEDEARAWDAQKGRRFELKVFSEYTV